MATFFNSADIGFWNSTANIIRGTLTGDVVRNGNTVTLRNLNLAMWATQSSWGTDTFTFNLNGTQTSFGLAPNGGTDMGNHGLNETSFGVSATQTSATVGWSTSDGRSGSFDVSFPSGATAPTGLTAQDIEPHTDGFSAKVSVETWGSNGSSDDNAYYRELQVWTYNASSLVEPRRYQAERGKDTKSSVITADNNSTPSSNPLTIRPNTLYTLGIYATNGVEPTGSQRIGNYATLALPPTVTLDSVDGNSATFSWATEADGGYYPKQIQYSLDGGETWITAVTVTGGAAQNGTFTIDGLRSGEQTVKVRALTDAGTSDGEDIAVQTGGINGLVFIDGEMRKAVGALCSVNGIARKITGVLDSKNGIATK